MRRKEDTVQVQVVHPFWLLVLLALPLTLLLERGSFSAIGRIQRVMATTIRFVLLILLALALSGFQVRDPDRPMQVVYLVDRSLSVAPAEFDRAVAYVRLALEELPEAQRDHTESALLIFGRNASFEHGFSNKLDIQQIQSVIEESNTDISRALELAAAVFDPGAEKRIVLLTDGRENIGNAAEQARRLRQRGISVDTVPIGLEQGDDVLARKMIVPQKSDRRETFDLKCVVDATVEKDALIKLYRNNVFITEREVHLTPGRNVFPFSMTESRKGFYTYSFEVDAEGDSESANNRARNFTMVEGEPRMLYLTGDPNEGPDLARMLEPKDIDLEFHQSAYMPHDLAELLTYDAVIFSDVSAETLTPDQQNLIKGYVQALGKGFVMLGGEQSFGVGGWYQSTVEEVLPVTMDFKRQQHFPATALAIVIDRSGSMGAFSGGYTKLDLAKKAAIEAGTILTPRDYIGVVQFDDSGYWVTEKLQKVTSKSKLRAQVGSITIGGGTNIYAGLRPAMDELIDSPAQVKHIILLTDGMSAPGDYNRIERECEEYGITLTTVATGPDSNEMFLKPFAEACGGRYYPLMDARNLPRIFTKETFLAATKSVIEEPFFPSPGEVHPITAGFPFVGSRALLGYNATSKKDLATVSMTAPSGDPLLAHWNYGLGKSIAFTSDAKSRWGAAWVGWTPAQGLWTQAVRWLVGEQDTKELVANVSRDGAATTVSVDSFTFGGDLDAEGEITAHIVTPDMEVVEIPLRQISPGRFELTHEFIDEGNYVVNLVKEQDGEVTGILHTGFAVSYSPEYEAAPPNTFLLNRVAETTLGAFDPPPGAVYRPVQVETQGLNWLDLTIPLLIASVLLFPFDVAVRRIMLPEEGMQVWIEAATAGVLGVLRPAERANRARRTGQAQPSWKVRAEREAKAEAKAAAAAKPAATGPSRISRSAQGSDADLEQRVGSILTGSRRPPENEEEDTYQKLLAAKRRARGNRDESK